MTAALNTLLQHAERQRDEGLAAVQRAEETLRQMAAQAAQLQAYRNDYRQRHPAQGGRSASIELLRCHQGFMQRLEQAIAQQAAQQQQASLRLQQQQAALVGLQLRVASVEKLLQRRDAEARQREAQREQRRADDAVRSAPRWHSTTQAVPL